MTLRPFELALVVVFIVLGITSVVLLSTYDGAPNTPNDGPVVTGPVEIWGTMPGAGMQTIVQSYATEYESYADVSYRYVAPSQFNSTLINALADDAGPDLVVLSHEELVDLRRRIFPDTYEVFPVRDIRSRYVDGAEIFALSDGLYARPLAVDPLVLYWNRDLLTSAGFLTAPATWEALVTTQFEALIDRDFDRTINRAVVAMGEYDNVRNAFGVLSMLLLQGGTAGVVEQNNQYQLLLDQRTTGGGEPLQAATDFYTRFSRPANNLFSWNRSLGEDRTEFVGQDLVFYFGYGSEGRDIERLNPNLNFDIAPVPQGEQATVPRTYGRFYGMAMMRSTDNYTAANVVLNEFTRPAVADQIATVSNMVPVTRATVAAGSNDTYGRIAYQSASVAYGWLNPNRAAADQAFGTMILDVVENRSTIDQAIADALNRLALEY